ncbi:TPA: hypothetical protein ACPY6A_002463, partial [Yersinia enterocolitica]
ANRMKKSFKCVLDTLVESAIYHIYNKRYRSPEKARLIMADNVPKAGYEEVSIKLLDVFRNYHILADAGYTVDDGDVLNFIDDDLSFLLMLILEKESSNASDVLYRYLKGRYND